MFPGEHSLRLILSSAKLRGSGNPKPEAALTKWVATLMGVLRERFSADRLVANEPSLTHQVETIRNVETSLPEQPAQHSGADGGEDASVGGKPGVCSLTIDTRMSVIYYMPRSSRRGSVVNESD